MLNSIKRILLNVTGAALKKGFLERINTANGNRVILLKPDAIGDYIIARNLMNYYIQHPVNKNAEFYLIANSKLKTLIDATDKGLYQEILYLDNSITSKFKNLYRFYFRINKLKSKRILFPVYSPTHEMDELVMMTGAPEKAGIKGDLVNKPEGTFPKGKVEYTLLVDVDAIHGSEFSHEFLKMKLFFEALIDEKIPVQKPALPVTTANTKFSRIVICPGSAGAYKIWDPGNYAALIDHLKAQHPQLSIDIICGPGEEYLGEKIKAQTNNFNKLINVKDISVLCAEIEKCDMVISNDSAPIHIAAALDVYSVCIFNGSRYGRFVPYPAEITDKSMAVVPPQVRKKMENGNPGYMQYLYRNLTGENINSIGVEDVMNTVKKVLLKIA